MTLYEDKKLLGFNISTLKLEEIIQLILEKIKRGESSHIVTINPEIIELSNKDKEFEKAILEADLLIPDGVGVVMGLNFQGAKIKRIPGIDLSERLIEIASERGCRVGLLGSSQEVIKLASNRLQSKYLNLDIAFSHNGFFTKENEEKIVEDIKNKDIQILFVAMGIPKQEIFINKYKNKLNRTIMIGVGGSFDVWANKVQRAPEIFQNLGLEWFYRLITQPSRFSRMFPTLPVFLLKVISSILKGDKS